MSRKAIAAAIVVTMCAIAFSQSNDPAQSGKPVPKGQRIFICGHSFHVGIAAGLVRASALVNPLQEVAQSAGIADQKLVGAQFLGGSQVIKHWNLPDEKDKARKALRTGEVDVLTLSPKGQLPDEGIEKFTALALEHNPNVRIFVQESWASFDSPGVSKRRADFKNQDRDITKVEELRKTHAPLFKELAALVQGLNDKLKEKEKRQVVYLVPAGPAVFTLREKVAQGNPHRQSARNKANENDRENKVCYARVEWGRGDGSPIDRGGCYSWRQTAKETASPG